MTLQEKINAKTITMEELYTKIPDGAVIGSSGGGAEPRSFYRNLHTIADRLTKPVVLHGGVGGGAEKYPYFWDDAYKDKFVTWSGFYGPTQRENHARGVVSHVPTHLHASSDRWLDEYSYDVYLLGGCPFNRHGYSFNGLGTPSYRAIKNTPLVVLLLNPNIPIVYGETEIHIDMVDYIVEENSPINTFEPGPLTDVDRTIGENVASLVEDGSTIQLGIGAIPDAVAQAFLVKKDLGIHTEMVTSSMADLVLAGVANGSKKTIFPNRLIGGFVSGSQKLVDFVTENPSVHLYPFSFVNNPWLICQNYKMCSINTCIEVDLTGQIASETIGPRQFSGTGGQNDTAEGAIHCPGGKSIIAFASAVTKKDGTRLSKIKSMLTPGSVVTMSRNNIDFIVTEYGIAPMKARTVRQRVENMIAIAHPDFRDELREQAKQLMLW
ncbi:MAG: 4-hydroxybutyrate--acetyl-CoA CoA transferase [Clostridiales bacterium]|nr:4-hydroxybutyrate--acetyl-CoA CoA transferase [Clostridiales bacterium]